MQLACEPCPLHRPGALPQPPHQIDVIDRGADLLREFLQKSQLLLWVPDSLRIQNEYPTRPFPPEPKRHRPHGLERLNAHQIVQKCYFSIAQALPAAVQHHGIEAFGASPRVDGIDTVMLDRSGKRL